MFMLLFVETSTVYLTWVSGSLQIIFLSQILFCSSFNVSVPQLEILMNQSALIISKHHALTLKIWHAQSIRWKINSVMWCTFWHSTQHSSRVKGKPQCRILFVLGFGIIFCNQAMSIYDGGDIVTVLPLWHKSDLCQNAIDIPL